MQEGEATAADYEKSRNSEKGTAIEKLNDNSVHDTNRKRAWKQGEDNAWQRALEGHGCGECENCTLAEDCGRCFICRTRKVADDSIKAEVENDNTRLTRKRKAASTEQRCFQRVRFVEYVFSFDAAIYIL